MTEDSTPETSGPEPLAFDAAADRLASFDFDTEPKRPEPEDEPPEAHAAEETDDTPSEDAEEAPDEAGADDDAEPDASSDDTSKIRLRDGREFSLADAKRALGRESAHAREMAQAQAQAQEYQAKLAQLSQQEEYFRKVTNHALQVAQSRLPPKPDPALADSDPIEYFVQKDKYERAVNEVRSLQQVQAQQEAKAQEAADTEFRSRIATEQGKLIEKVPEFKSEKARKAFWGEAIDTLEHYGFSSAEASNVHDHRLMLLLKDAVAYRKLQTQRPKAVEKAKDAPPVATPAKRPSRVESVAQKRNALTQQLRKTGDFATGVALLSQFD